MSLEIITEVQKRSEKFLNWIELTVDDANAIKAAIAFFEYNSSALKAIIKLAQIDLAATQSIDLENNSLNALKSVYSMNVLFNKEKADNSFKTGLELIITQGYTYNKIYFQKGKDKIWI